MKNAQWLLTIDKKISNLNSNVKQRLMGRYGILKNALGCPYLSPGHHNFCTLRESGGGWYCRTDRLILNRESSVIKEL